MESYEILGFLLILRESMKAISKNVKLIATITTISILLNSLVSFTKSFSTKPAISDLVTQATLYNLSKNNTSNFTDSYEKIIMKDVQIIIGFEFLYFLPSVAIYVFSMVTMILASVVAYSDKNLSFRDFLPRIPKLCLRTLATSFYLKIFAIGYIVLFSAFLISLMLLNIDHPLVILPIVIILGVFAVIFWMYLDVAWNMALVVSVIEKNSYGLEALGKAGGLVQGRRIHGFTLSLFCTIVMIIISLVFSGSPNHKSVSMQIIWGSFPTVLNCLVKMVYFMSYTVLYFQCKKTHGEQIELHGNVLEYSKIPS
jgi:hypothetical protein